MKIAAARIGALLEDADCWRGPPVGATANLPSHLPFKEWQHFIVFGDDWTLVFNLNLDGAAGGRVITIVGGDAWHGQIDRCPAPRLRPGHMDASFGDAGMRWRGGRYELWQHTGELRLECVLVPAAAPSLTHHIRLGPGAHLSWCLVPRLSASGWLERGGRRVAFAGRFAYHDHNWGRFHWGGDFSWDWGCAVPEDLDSPWTVVFARMNDRARHRTTATSLFLLKDGRYLRYFRNAEVSFASEGSMPGRPAGRVPSAAALILPDADRDVPLQTRFAAHRDADSLYGEVEGRTRGQVLVPSETDLRALVRLNEVHTRVAVHGRCAGETVEMQGPGLLEVVRG